MTVAILVFGHQGKERSFKVRFACDHYIVLQLSNVLVHCVQFSSCLYDASSYWNDMHANPMELSYNVMKGTEYFVLL
jgi:hypothetical protein